MFVILEYHYLLYIVSMNQIHIISGTVIATIALLLVTATMSDQQSAFAHEATIITVIIIMIKVMMVVVRSISNGD